MVVETLSQADEYLSPEIEACLNNAGDGSAGRLVDGLRRACACAGRRRCPTQLRAHKLTGAGLARRERQKREQRPAAPPAGCRHRAARCRGQPPCDARIPAGAAGAGAGAAPPRLPRGRWLCQRARRPARRLCENRSRKQQRDAPARRPAAAEPPTPPPTCPAAAPPSTPAAAGNPAPNQDGAKLRAQVRRRLAGPASPLKEKLFTAGCLPALTAVVCPAVAFVVGTCACTSWAAATAVGACECRFCEL